MDWESIKTGTAVLGAVVVAMLHWWKRRHDGEDGSSLE